MTITINTGVNVGNGITIDGPIGQPVLPAASPGVWNAVAYGNGTYVAVASATTPGVDKAAYCLDGTNWVASTLPSSRNWFSVAYGNGVFVATALGPTNAGAISSNGITWTATTLPASDSWTQIAFGNGIFVVIGDTNNVTAVSSDGINWSSGTLPAAGQWVGLAYGGGIFVAITSGAITAVSSDGISWTQGTITDSDWSAVTYGNGVFVAVDENVSFSRTAASSNGLTWTPGTSDNDIGYRCVAYGNGQFIALPWLATGGVATTTAKKSTNGTTWTRFELPAAASYLDITFGQDSYRGFAGVGGNTSAVFSRDGTTWY